ncbi:Cytochrome P450 [Glarea lozoyensis ATCC 20868]|uniref:Cytochrome P450 n=1 Tax=Glarea lozoyensis (strain ATCC 20868 / MF5171) TaxID=1116229 RepID=S3D9P0_GLAL2|nr:Cytochrome P450 [Glarea lozoyensis ATCC 20868]EPE34465.1 Cytochrome P450 [Glarea lozoyensis ATCC 20868]
MHLLLTAENLWNNRHDRKLVLSSSLDGKCKVSLLQWVQATPLEGATNAFFGEALLARNPGLLDDFSEFDERSWQLSNKIPRPWPNKMQIAKQSSLDALTAYFQSPADERPGSCWLVQTLEKEMRAASIGDVDIAANLMMAYWVINGNAWKVCFWIMAYLAENQELYSAIKKEVAPVVAIAQSPNALSDCLDRCPLLTAVYQETLQVVTSSVSARNIIAHLELGGKLLQPGNMILILYRQILMNEEVLALMKPVLMLLVF